MSRLLALKMKLNEARTKNNIEVINEEKRLTDKNDTKRKRAKNWYLKQEQLKKELKLKGIDEK